MKHLANWVVALSVAVTVAHAVEPAEVAYYACQPCAAPPVLDGRLDDACWAGLPVMDQFYKYWSPVPLPPPLKTAARLCYDDRGLYMGVTMFEEQMDKIKAEVTSRDDPETWQDDCVEIMFDPLNTGHSYVKFTTNFRAARHDQKSANLVLDDGWSVEGWQVKTARSAEGWTIEFFLPWQDVDAKAKAGDFWSFDLVRYGYSSGGFRGVSWSLGGSGAAPAKFGVLGFGMSATLAPEQLSRLAEVVRRTKGDRFRVVVPPAVLTHQADGQWTRETVTTWLASAERQVTGELAQAEGTVNGLPPSPDRERLNKVTAEGAGRLRELQAGMAQGAAGSAGAILLHHDLLQLARQVAEAKWEAKVLELVATTGQ